MLPASEAQLLDQQRLELQLNHRGVVLAVNPGASKAMFGFAPQELVGRRLAAFVNLFGQWRGKFGEDESLLVMLGMRAEQGQDVVYRWGDVAWCCFGSLLPTCLSTRLRLYSRQHLLAREGSFLNACQFEVVRCGLICRLLPPPAGVACTRPSLTRSWPAAQARQQQGPTAAPSGPQAWPQQAALLPLPLLAATTRCWWR